MSHRKIITTDTGGYPLDLQTIEFMQNGYNDCLAGLASAFGDNVIVSGVADLGTNYGNGWVIVDGELLPFVGGLKNTRIVVEETIVQVEFEDTVSKDAEVTRVAKCASSGGVLFTDFVRLDATHLKRSQEHSVLNTKVIEIGPWNMDLDNFINLDIGVSFKKLRSVNIVVRSDSDDLYGTDNYFKAATFEVKSELGVQNAFQSGGVDRITIGRAIGGRYDNATYNSILINRGWVTIQYID